MPKWNALLVGDIRRWALSCTLAAGGFVLGNTLREPQVTGQEDRNAPTRKAFLSGSERSVLVLDDILVLLKQMDGRLERIEKTITAKPQP